MHDREETSREGGRTGAHGKTRRHSRTVSSVGDVPGRAEGLRFDQWHRRLTNEKRVIYRSVHRG